MTQRACRLATPDRPVPTRAQIVGDSPQARALRNRIRRYAITTAPVLLQGETGAGKEVSARAIHHHSPRRSGPFVAVNCAALPTELVESELFGCVAGAFTGARGRQGRFLAAEGGTIFLDEIGDLPLRAQGVLLRVLETNEVWQVGTDQPTLVDCRVLSASHRDLATMVRAGQFRADLYHRLSALRILIPPLRERPQDIRPLAQVFIGATVKRFTANAFARLARHSWPGNARELRNVLLRALAEYPVGEIDGSLLLFSDVAEEQAAGWDGRSLRAILADVVIAAYTQHDRNARATARALRCSPTTVYRYLGPVR